MLKLGNKIISDIYLGDKKIAKVFLGDKLVYQAGKPIFLDYIITDGNSWIDTGYYPDDTKSIVEYDFEVHTQPSTEHNGLLGSRESFGSYVYNVFYQSNLELRLDYGLYTGATLYTTSLNTKYTMKAGMGEIYINDELVKSYTVTMGLTPYSIYLGNFNEANNTYATGTPQNIYGFRAYEDGVLVKDLRPCIAPNGQVAMYDEVNKKYHYNQGTGELKAGGRFVKSILFDGASWIDTGYIPTSNTRVVGSVIYNKWHTGSAHYTFGVFGNNKSYGFAPGGNGSLFYAMWGGSSNSTSLRPILGEKYHFDFSKNGVYINDTEYVASSKLTAVFEAEKSLYIGWGNGTSSPPTAQIIFFIQIYENDILIQDLRPCIDPKGVVCMHDTVTKKYFYNQGTGTLGYTE